MTVERMAGLALAVPVLTALVACGLLAGTSTEVPPDAGAAPPSTIQFSQPSGEVIPPEAFTYLGAFRLPGGDERPRTFAYGGNAMTYRPDGNPNGPHDGFPGSLFLTGHARLPYGELPDGDQVAEITIPAPLAAESIEALNQSEFVQDFADIARGQFGGLDEITRLERERDDLNTMVEALRREMTARPRGQLVLGASPVLDQGDDPLMDY